MERQNEHGLKVVETALRRFLEGCCLRVESGIGPCQMTPPLNLTGPLDFASSKGISSQLISFSRLHEPADCSSSHSSDCHRLQRHGEPSNLSGRQTSPAFQEHEFNFKLKFNSSYGQDIQQHSDSRNHSSTSLTGATASSSHGHFCAALLNEEPYQEPFFFKEPQRNQGTAHCGVSVSAKHVADDHDCRRLVGVPHHPLYKRLASALFHLANKGEETRVGTRAGPGRFQAAWEASTAPQVPTSPSPSGATASFPGSFGGDSKAPPGNSSPPSDGDTVKAAWEAFTAPQLLCIPSRPTDVGNAQGHGCDQGTHCYSGDAEAEVRNILQNLLKMRDQLKLELHVQSPYYEQLRNGEKTVEGRCADAKYRNLNTSDVILFNQALFMRVIRTVHYASFWDMLQSEGLCRALPGVDSLDAGAAIYRQFYSAERESENGVLAIHVERVNLVNSSTGQMGVNSVGLGLSDSNADCRDIPQLLGKVLQRLGFPGICRLIGMSLTEGSIPGSLPPPRTLLIRAFNALHKAVLKPQPDLSAGDDSLAAEARDLGRDGNFNSSESRGSNALPAGLVTIEPEPVTRGTAAVASMALEPQPVTCDATAVGSIEGEGVKAMKSESGGGAHLTVGARALCKHSHRDSWHAFWPQCSGPEAEKNRIANAALEKILDNATWMNTHVLPGGVAVFEARVKEGYGARWSADGAHFRGLLEPPMDEGHELKWRH